MVVHFRSSCIFGSRLKRRVPFGLGLITQTSIIYIYAIIYHSGVGSIRSHKLWLISIINVVHQKNPLGLRPPRIDIFCAPGRKIRAPSAEDSSPKRSKGAELNCFDVM